MKRFAVVSLFLLVAVFAQASDASAENYGNWFTGTATDGAFFFALTTNDSGNAFGQWCYVEEKNCYWLLAMKTRCDLGDKYVLLVNSDSGAKALDIYCYGPAPSRADMYRYAFSNFDEINSLALNNPRIGFAFPLQSDSFQVVRFNLDGAAAAINAMRTTAEQRIYRRTRGTRDEKL